MAMNKDAKDSKCTKDKTTKTCKNRFGIEMLKLSH